MNGMAGRTAKRATQSAVSFSTSEGRANFALALETAGKEKTVVGFDRYGQPIAALVPIEAVQMLAGQADVDAAARAKITRMAKAFLSGGATPKKAEPKTAAKHSSKKAAKAAKAVKKTRGRR